MDFFLRTGEPPLGEGGTTPVDIFF
jgi:hypothetical protein